MRKVTRAQVLAWRMRRHHLTEPGDVSAVDLARRLAGVQAQVPSSAAQAVAFRQLKPDADEIDRALRDDRTLVRTWSVRGTLHLHAADDLAFYGAAMAAVRTWERPSVLRGHGVTLAEITAIIDAIAEVLPGRVLTREELTEAVLEHTGSPHLAEVLRSGWGFALKPASWLGLLCQGPSDGNRVTFTSPSTWLPGWRPVSADVAGPELVKRYLGAHGPSTVADFDKWFARSTKASLLKAWFAGARDELEEVSVDGTPMLARAEDIDELESTAPNKLVRLLPAFDQYVIAVNRDLIPAEHLAKVSRAAGWISPVVLHGGRVAGVWKEEGGVVRAEQFERIPEKALAEEVARVLPGTSLG
ncbi:winged helix DNA-binding domain-containing protein [Allokutzneria albata]|uniref:Winged helix DNA-binding domain-containing protein n=1 Tax=Allokutzneria albata TaxID=211114 RepID=A0A1G9TB37_ALLAB|nr:winged helix DNA-binding domain-containing protein [Allokutzneria albata]SDM44844.1 Winged helix DNA-binding domain-containing protein [Allokutzneria albata]